MAQKDLSSKVLEAHNEIFANIFNTFAFNGEQILNPDFLEDEPTENIFLDIEGDYRNNMRDVFKSYKIEGASSPVRLAYLGIENQTKIDKAMVVRILSYTANCYKRQCDEIAITRRALNKQLKLAKTESQKLFIEEELNRYSVDNIVPVITLVVNFNKQKWEYNINLSELVKDSNPFKRYMHNFKIHVVNVLYLSDEEIEQLTNDFKALVILLAKQEATLEELNYPLDVLMALYAYTNDTRYLAKKNDILRKLSQGGKITMPEIYDEIQRKKAVKIAEKLITMGKFTLEDIAEGTGLPLETVQELAKQTAA